MANPDRLSTSVEAGLVQDWTISLCAPGTCTDCCYAYCCTPCALAQARTNLDGSSCCFNFLLGNAISMRWMLRTAYGIPGDDCADCYTTLCCPCCVVNQMYQTSKTFGDPFGPAPGAHLIRGQEWAGANEPCDCGTCMYACFCLYCAQASILGNAMGMGFCMGCCCVNPCFARNMVKVHYRVGKSDDDCCYDCLVPGIISAPFGGALVYPYLVYFLMQMSAETKVRGQAVQPRYIAGYNPPNTGFNPFTDAQLSVPMKPMESMNTYNQPPPQSQPQQPWPTYANTEPLQPQQSMPYMTQPQQAPYSIQQQQSPPYTPGPPGQTRY